MNANFSKRFAAFIVDMLIISMISGVIVSFIPKSKNYDNLNDKLIKITEKYSNGIVSKDKNSIDIDSVSKYIDEASAISYQMDKSNFISKIVEILIFILYFVVLQFKLNGQTLGKKLMKIKVENEFGTLTVNDLLFRSLLINSILFSLISVILIFTTKNLAYVYTTGMVSIIDLIFTIVCGFVCLIRKDNKALHDIITKTKVVEVK